MRTPDPPRFGAGSRLGPYELIALLGAGGMGEVYRARDPRLGRDVAIKVLLPDSSFDPARLSRFEQEARAVGALNHPNLLAVHDTGRHDGTVYIVFELLEGETLRKRLASGPVAPARAIDLALQIAHGLAAAHERGIVHRDLKPENIFVTRDGRVKILDFGLAKLRRPVEDAAGVSEAVTVSEMTQPGTVMGTVAYMSPEQVKSQPADVRSDIFSLGAVLYELLSSKRAFEGSTTAEIMSAILKDEPPELALPNGPVPAALDRVIRRCLEKNPEERFHSAHDLALALEVAASAASVSGSEGRAALREGPLWRRTAVALTLLAVAAAILGAWAVRRMGPTEPRAVRSAGRFTLLLPDGTTSSERTSSVAITRDGTTVAAVAQRAGVSALYVRALERWDWKRLPSTEGAWSPFFSPDGEWVGFFVPGKLQRVAVAGGTPHVICEVVNGGTATWGEDGQILLAAGLEAGVWRVPSGGGSREIVVAGKEAALAVSYGNPRLLPGGRAVLFSTWTPAGARVEVLPLEGGRRRALVDGAHGHYTPTGHLLYLSQNQILAVPFDRESLAVRGVGIPVVDDVRRPRGSLASADFAVSETGTLVYAPDTRPQIRFVSAGRNGKPSPLPLPSRNYTFPALSPEGDRVAVTVADGSGRDVWVGDLVRGTLSRLTSDGDAVFSLWSPDGKDVVYTSSRAGRYNLFRKRVDGDAEPERLTESLNAQRATSWSPDGRVLLLNDVNPLTRVDVSVLPLEGDRKPRPLLKTAAGELNGVFSPDGRWIAYTSDESGRLEVYVQAYPDLGHKRQISTDGGAAPAWASGGGELFYLHGDQILIVAIEYGNGLRIGAPRVLFQGPLVEETRRAGPYAVTRDGKRLLLLEDVGDKAASMRLHVVRDWFDELSRRVPIP